MKKRLVLAVVMTLVAVMNTLAWADQANQSDKADRAKDAAIKQYLKAAPIDTMLNDAMAGFLKMVPPDSKQTIEDTFKAVDRKKIADAMIASMKKHFTTSEIKSLAKFYASPDGKEVMRKMPAMQAEVLPVLQGEISAAMMGVYEKTKQKE